MAVMTWQITHSCGHRTKRDLSDRAADRRAGFAEWLAEQERTGCRRAAKEDDEQDKAAWLKAKRAEEQAESEAWSDQYRMPPLERSERAVAWGVRCGNQIVAAACTTLVLLHANMAKDEEHHPVAGTTVTASQWSPRPSRSPPATGSSPG